MFKINSSARLARRIVFLSTALLALSPVRGQTEPQQLDRYITTVTRTPAAPQTLGSAVDVISADDLARSQTTSLSAALGSAAGAPLFASGAPGSVTSLFMRGANSNQTLFLVDGIRLNDPNTDYQVFLGGASLGAGDRLEIARGPQSTLYGGEAIGGVVSLNTARGVGPATSAASVEAGSFDTIDGAIACQGTQGANAWNFSAGGGHTENDRPNNRFNSENVSLRLDREVTAQLGVGGTLRWFHGELGSPGDRFTNDVNNRETEDNLLGTAFANLKLASAWTMHAIVGGQNRRYIDDTPAPNQYGSPSAKVIVTNRRGVIDAQTTYSGIERNRVTFGTTAETEQTRNTGFGAIDHNQQSLAFFAQDEYSPIDNVYLTGGLRNDDFNTFGRDTTGRVTAAWLVIPKTLKLRTSYGTGFRSPSFLDLYGQDSFYKGARILGRNLNPEHSRGVDGGVDIYLPAQRGTISVTGFETEFRDLITYDFSAVPSTVINVGRARTQGLEISTQLKLPGAVEGHASYTYLDAQELDNPGHTRLLRRPQHQLSADLNRTFGGTVIAGAGVRYVGKRADIDAQYYTPAIDGAFAVARVYARWQATPQLAVKGRIENALNRKYEEVNGYPALGIGAFGGVEWKF